MKTFETIARQPGRKYYYDPIIDEIGEALETKCGIDCGDNGNCSISEFANLLMEIQDYFAGDNAAALAAIRAGKLQFEEIHQPDGWAWHIKPR